MEKQESSEKAAVYVIPANYIESGRILNGMLKTRNTIEAVIVVLVGFLLLSILPLSAQAGITTKVALLSPIAAFFLIGVNNGPASAFIFSMLHWYVKKDILKYNENAEPLKGTALQAIESRKAPAEKLAEKIRSWREEKAARQLADEDTAIEFASDPFVSDLNRYFGTHETREMARRETNIENEDVPVKTPDDIQWQDIEALNVDEKGVVGGGFYEHE